MPKPKTILLGAKSNRKPISEKHRPMPSQTHALPPAEPTPALAALAEVFGGAHASPLSLTDGREFPMREVRRSARRKASRPPSPGAARQVRSETCISRDWANASI